MKHIHCAASAAFLLVSAALFADRAATPVFDPGPGTYSSVQMVTISSATPGAVVRYTTDGSVPEEGTGKAYTAAVPVSTSVRITAVAFKRGMEKSLPAVALYEASTVILPMEGHCYHGVFLGVDSGNYYHDHFGLKTRMQGFLGDAGKSVRFLQQFFGWDSDDVTAFRYIRADCDELLKQGIIPLITWEPDCDNATINRGERDAYIDRWAGEIAAWGRPVFIRPMHEMNLPNVYIWDIGYGGNTNASFLSAWKRIVDRFRSAGATNVAWVWCINEWPRMTRGELSEFYPGDDYVDWIGIDGYNWGSIYQGNRSFEEIMRPPQMPMDKWPYDSITSLTSKPLMVGESSCIQDEKVTFGRKSYGPYATPGSKPGWILGAFEKLRTEFTRIKAFCWYNQSGFQVLDGRNIFLDWSIQTFDRDSDAYAKAVGNDYFVGGR